MRSMIPRGDPNGPGFSSPFDDPVKASDHTLGGQGKVDLDAEALTVEIIQDVQQPKCAAIHCPAVHVYMHERGQADPP